MNDESESIGQPTAFEWDSGNADKNWKKHGVRSSECEEIFFNRPLLVLDDIPHSSKELRRLALGKTHAGRRLFLVFTHRGDRIRVISARDMSKGERRSYDQAEEEADS